MPLEPNLVHCTPPFDAEGLRRLGEGSIANAVTDLNMSEVCSARAALISRLAAKLHMQAPRLLAERSSEKVLDHLGGYIVTIEVPLEDPNSISSLINPPDIVEPIYFEQGPTAGTLIVTGRFPGCSEDHAFARMSQAISEYQENIDSLAHFIERYNAALPYLISAVVQEKVDDLSELTRPDDEEADRPPTKGEIKAVMDELVEEGKLVAVREINADTGDLQTRYYAARHAPKVN